jgi:hypothetical protein
MRKGSGIDEQQHMQQDKNMLQQSLPDILGLPSCIGGERNLKTARNKAAVIPFVCGWKF